MELTGASMIHHKANSENRKKTKKILPLSCSFIPTKIKSEDTNLVVTSALRHPWKFVLIHLELHGGCTPATDKHVWQFSNYPPNNTQTWIDVYVSFEDRRSSSGPRYNEHFCSAFSLWWSEWHTKSTLSTWPVMFSSSSQKRLLFTFHGHLKHKGKIVHERMCRVH